ncbi:MAG: VOC family protein [Bacteroidota bacterium]
MHKSHILLLFSLLFSSELYSQQTFPLSSYASSTIAIPVGDLEKAGTWMQKVFGELPTDEPAPGIIEFQLNEQTWLQLFEEKEASNSAIIRVEVPDINMAYQHLVDAGVQTGQVEKVPEVVYYLDFQDDYGNKFSFYELLLP